MCKLITAEVDHPVVTLLSLNVCLSLLVTTQVENLDLTHVCITLKVSISFIKNGLNLRKSEVLKKHSLISKLDGSVILSSLR